MRLCIFCGSASGRNEIFARAAADLGAACADNGIEIVYGGGRVGLMGTVASASLARGGRVIGVIPRTLVEREVAHDRLTELHVVETMHERKALMGRLADAFVALPGGFGTFEEFCEVVTWVQLGMYERPALLVNVGGYYDPLVAMFDRAVSEGFVSERNRAIVTTFNSVGTLVEHLLVDAPL